MYKIRTMSEVRCDDIAEVIPKTRQWEDMEFSTNKEAQLVLNMLYGIYRKVADDLNGEIIDIFKVESNHAALVTKRKVSFLNRSVDITSVIESVITHD